MSKFKCTMLGCSYSSHAPQGLSAHQRGHVMRGEATFSGDILVPTGVPIAKTQYERQQRREEKKTTEIVHAGTVTPAPNHAVLTRTQDQATVDISQLSGEQLERLRDHFAPPPKSSGDRLREALVFTTVAEMLEERPPEEILMLLQGLRQVGR